MQIFIRFPLGSIAHWRFGYLRTCFVGLYFPRRRFRFPPMREPFPHIGHVVIICVEIKYFLCYHNYNNMSTELLYFKFFSYIVIILSAIFHEYAHGWVAYRLGDPTAKYAGRLTLNPLPHMELFGTVILPLSLLFFFGGFIGWAKPVPYNPYNLSDRRFGSLKVAIAGPATNLLIALLLGFFLRFSPFMGGMGILPPFFLTLIAWIVYINIFLALFNLIPVPPLDGSKILADLLPHRQRGFLDQIGPFGLFIALIIAFVALPGIADLIFLGITGTSF